MYACAVLYANINPVHAACKSKQTAPSAPIAFCTSQAVQGSTASGDIVDTTIISNSSGRTPVCASACLPASTAIDTVDSDSAIWRFSTPVRSRIHASFVSTIFDRSSLSMIFTGILDPVPHIFPIIISASLFTFVFILFCFKIF